MNQIKRVLILGHTGFIGSHLGRFFREHSPAVEIMGRSTSSVDLTKMEETFRLADLLGPTTAVLFCSGIKKQRGDNLETFSKNLAMVINLCRVLQDRPVARLVFFSSAAVYGEDIHNTNITEETPIHPTSYYGFAKYASEGLLQHTMGQQGEGSLLILRPTLIYGPGDQSSSYGPLGFVKAAINKEPIMFWGDGSERREFMFIADLVTLVHRLTFHEYVGVLNIVSGRSYTFKEAWEIVARLVPFELPTSSRSRTKRKVDHGFYNMALTRLFPDFSFTDLEHGIKQTWEIEHETASHLVAGCR